MEDKETKIKEEVLQFRSLVRDNKYFTLDGKTELSTNIYRKLTDITLSNLTIEEKFYLIKENQLLSTLTETLRGYSNNLIR